MPSDPGLCAICCEHRAKAFQFHLAFRYASPVQARECVSSDGIVVWKVETICFRFECLHDNQQSSVGCHGQQSAANRPTAFPLPQLNSTII